MHAVAVICSKCMMEYVYCEDDANLGLAWRLRFRFVLAWRLLLRVALAWHLRFRVGRFEIYPFYAQSQSQLGLHMA